ncbi:MAG: GIY-YIG nuclease family protein [Chitinophagaceae bacterium]|nr:GIY-YIG nuclease family protein [Chitinophagaceae bacterium]
MYFVYILWSDKLNRFYTGTTDNIETRLEQHNSGIYTDAFSAKDIPWKLFYVTPGIFPIDFEI